MKKKNKIAIAVVSIVLLLSAIMGIYQIQEKSKNYSDKKIPVGEIKAELEAVTGVKIKVSGKYLTYKQLEEILEDVHLKQYITYSEKYGSKKVEQKEWNSIYEHILDYLDTKEQISKKKLLILSVDEKEKKVYTSQGTFSLMDDLLRATPFETYEVYIYKDNLLGIVNHLEDEMVLSNAYLKSMKNGKIKILFDKRDYVIETNTKNKDIDPSVCDLIFKEQKVTEIQKKEETIEGKLITMDQEKIEIEGYGQISLAERVPVYRVYGGLEEVSLEDIVLDNMKVSYVVGKGKVQAILLREPAEIQNVRVLLLNEGAVGYENIWLTSDKDFHTDVNQAQTDYPGGQIISAKDIICDNTDVVLKITPTEGGKLYLTKEDGTANSLTYSGNFEIRKTTEGYTIVNVLSMEEYVCGVLPSEMPETFEDEALKAQAVCARSYAYIQLMKGAYAAYGAHVDDSTNYQVYNKKESSEKSRMAVQSTAGETLQYKNQVIEAYYFSTSCGHTGSLVNWNLTEDESNAYLKGIWVKEKEDSLDLSVEDNFKKYITAADESSFDSNVPYFRWKAQLDFNEKSETIRNLLSNQKKTSPENVSFYNGESEKKSIKGFGAITGVSVKERGSSGSILTLEIDFENGAAFLKNEYNIRKVLGSALTEFTCQDGSKNTSMTILPSSYCTVEYNSESKCASLQGGGFGHGIGMSQYGADAMAKKGYTYDKILKFYYQNIEIKNSY